MRWLAALALAACQSPSTNPAPPDAARTGLTMTFRSQPPGATAVFAPEGMPPRATPFVLTLPRDFFPFDVQLQLDGYRRIVKEVSNHGRDELIEISLTPKIDLPPTMTECRDGLMALETWALTDARREEGGITFSLGGAELKLRPEAGADTRWTHRTKVEQQCDDPYLCPAELVKDCNRWACRNVNYHGWQRRLHGVSATLWTWVSKPARSRELFEKAAPAVEKCMELM